MKLLFRYSILLLIVLSTYSTNAQISKSEKSALVDLYNSTNGDAWTISWNLNSSSENWHGVLIKDDHVVSIVLTNNNLQGIIPESIGNLKYLDNLDLAFNKLTGELPIEISKLSHLKVLKLEMNRLKGVLPKNFDKLVVLEELILFNNMIEGEIPESIGQAKNLKIINLSSNFLSGGLPKSIENLSQLNSLELFGNKFAGQIDVDLGKLKNLSELVLAYNNFEGAIPEGIQNLTQLQFVQLQGNRFNSFEGIENMKSEGLVTFDSDNNTLNKKYNDTRMADTKFENN